MGPAHLIFLPSSHVAFVTIPRTPAGSFLPLIAGHLISTGLLCRQAGWSLVPLLLIAALPCPAWLASSRPAVQTQPLAVCRLLLPPLRAPWLGVLPVWEGTPSPALRDP